MNIQSIADLDKVVKRFIESGLNDGYTNLILTMSKDNLDRLGEEFDSKSNIKFSSILENRCGPNKIPYIEYLGIIVFFNLTD